MRSSRVFGALLVAAAGLAAPRTATGQLEDVITRTEKVYGAMRLLVPAMLQAQAKILEAQGLKQLADQAKAAADAVAKAGDKADGRGTETVRDGGLSLSRISEDARKEQASRTDQAQVLTEAQKTMLKEGAKDYLAGVIATVAIAAEVPPLLQAVSSIQVPKNPMQAGKFLSAIKSAKTMGEAVPTTVTANVATAKALVAYLKANKIDVPEANMDFGTPEGE